MGKKLIICTHGNFGEALIESAEMIIGKLENASSYSLLPGMAPEELKSRIESQLSVNADQEYICLADLFGGTPCVVLSAMVRDYNVTLITGLNLAMLIEVYMRLQEDSVEKLSELALATLKTSGKCITKDSIK